MTRPSRGFDATNDWRALAIERWRGPHSVRVRLAKCISGCRFQALWTYRWQRDYADVKVSPKTRERYAQLIKNQIKPHLGQLQLQKLRPIHLTELYAKLLKDDLSARTVNHVHRLLHQ